MDGYDGEFWTLIYLEAVQSELSCVIKSLKVSTKLFSNCSFSVFSHSYRTDGIIETFDLGLRMWCDCRSRTDVHRYQTDVMGHYAIRLNDFIECLDKYDSKKIITKMFNLYLFT